ncbi:hypothetical protein [Desulfocurvus sp. DL9XJH121]
MSQRLLLFCMFLLLTGCIAEKFSNNEALFPVFGKPQEVYFVKTETPLYETRAAIKKLTTLHIGNEIGVFEIVDGMARTNAGWIVFKDIEKERSHFQLTVKAPEGAIVKILNIKPKYHDGIWLEKGKYHIGVYPKKKAALDRWIALEKDKVIVLDGSDKSRLVSLTVNAVSGATVKIMNVRAKYHPGIKLSPGKYHVVVYRGQHTYYDKWLNIDDDTVLPVEETCSPRDGKATNVTVKKQSQDPSSSTSVGNAPVDMPPSESKGAPSADKKTSPVGENKGKVGMELD